MIKQIEIENLKSINRLKIDCSALNLFIGTNSSGKSTILQGLLFVAQNAFELAGLNGNLVKLGNFGENKCVYSVDKYIRVKVVDANGYCMIKTLAIDDEKNTLELNTLLDCNYGLAIDDEKIKEKRINQLKQQFNYEDQKIQYLSCHRVGPQNLYEKNMTMNDIIGTNGEYAISYLNQHGGDSLEDSMCKNRSDYTLLGQVNYWLNEIVSAEIRTEEIPGADSVKASYRMNDVVEIRPSNIGSGISYLVSILIMCLSSTEGSVIVIENPEIHLHPSAQSKVCDFFYFIAQRGIQLFVESHSDHIFNGFRAGIATNTMNEEMLNIQFVSLGGEYTTQAEKVLIGKYGRVENQCKDLFDQFDIDLNRMIGI